MSKQDDSLFLFQFSSYQRPALEENKSKDWVLNGKKNEFYQYIIDRYNGSPTNASIINSYISLMYGGGLVNTSATNNASKILELRTMLAPKEVRKICSDFEMFGEASIQVVKAKKKTELPTLYHIPKNLVVPSLVNEDNEIEGYWYSRNWSKMHLEENKPIYYPSFGTSNESVEIYNIKPYKAGKDYFADPDYLAGLPYALMEEEIANLYVKCIQNGLSGGYIINVPDAGNLTPENKEEIKKQITNKMTGSNNAGQFVLNFKGVDEGIQVTPFPVNDNIHKQWEYLTAEGRQQLLTSHAVTSPMLFGIKDNTGFGNNADEMEVARQQILDYVIKPKRNYITEAIEDIAMQYNLYLNLSFKDVRSEQQVKTELKKKASIDDVAVSVADELIALGEDISDEWEVINVVEAKDTNLTENQLNSVFEFSARIPDYDKPRRTKSEQDTSLFKIRYKYAGEKTGQREFCNKVLNANKVYRAEDLNKEQTTTPKMGKGGSDKYNPFLYKGGVNCKHFWQRVIYLKKNNNKISVNQARKMILALEPSERKDAMWEQNDKKVAQIADSSNNFWKVN